MNDYIMVFDNQGILEVVGFFNTAKDAKEYAKDNYMSAHVHIYKIKGAKDYAEE